MRHKKVFVSGGAGVIGTVLVNQLLSKGVTIFVGDLKPCPQEWIGKVQYRQGDLNTITPEELEAFSPDLFFHLAATFERSEETVGFWSENFHHNIQLSHHLMNCLKTVSGLKRVIFASSYLVYDPLLYMSQDVPVGTISLNEETPLYPRNICGAAKLFHELELRFLNHFSQGSPTFVSARIFRVYGRQSKDVISRWIRSALRKETLTVYRPEGLFDYIFADDVAEGLFRLSEIEESGIVNLGFGEARRVEDILTILKSHFPHLKTEVVQSAIPYEASQADIQRLISWTQWKPRHTLEKGIAKLIEFETQHLDASHPSSYPGILISSISKKVPLIRAVKQAAAKLGQFKKLFGCDTNPDCIGQFEVDQFWLCPPQNEWTANSFIQYCQSHHIQAVIPTRDGELPFFSEQRELFEQQGIHVLISPHETILSCLDKLTFYERLSDVDWPVIPTAVSLNKLEPAEWYVVKERFGAGSAQIGIKLSSELANAHAKQLVEPVFQPFIEGQEWSIDVYRSRKGIIMGAVARSRDVIQKGESQVTTTATKPALENLCAHMADFLNIQGHAIFQVIEDLTGEFHVIECNPRFGGASTASVAVGLDSFYWFMLESTGQELTPQLFQRRKGEIRQIRYPTDRIISWSSSSI